ncbi:MAG: hypothetical protein ACRC8A_10440 [Microcoleaceae cyanobacterium]
MKQRECCTLAVLVLTILTLDYTVAKVAQSEAQRSDLLVVLGQTPEQGSPRPESNLQPSPQLNLQLTEAELRAACRERRYDLLPIPFADVLPTDWAFEAVMNLYYCIGLPPTSDS